MADKATPETSAPAEAPKTTKIDLRNPITVSNVHQTWNFPAGQDIEVPADMADDLKRMDREQEDYKASLLVKRTSTVDAGSFAVGNGAE